MRQPLRIFIGSSQEALARAKDVQDLLYDEENDGEDTRGIIVKAWWSNEVFRVGDAFIESLERVFKETHAAILLATEDDQITVRGAMETAPRDNIAFECGMAISAHGRQLTALAVIGAPKLPTDLSGVKHLRLDPGDSRGEFKERNRGKIRDLLDQWRAVIDTEDLDRFRTQDRDRGPLESSSQLDDPETLRRVDPSSADREVARTLVEEIENYSAGLLSKTNLVWKYQINRLAVPELCQKMNSRVRPRSDRRPTPHLVTVAEYDAFEKDHDWRALGYNVQRIFEADNGTPAISGVSEKQLTELLKGAGANPYEAIPNDGSALDEPVRSVSWFDAVAYCLSVGGRLPTAEDLNDRSSGERRREVWEWTQSWFSESAAHITVNRPRRRPIGVNPDLRLPNLGFRVIMVR